MNRKYLCFLLGFILALLSSFTANAQTELPEAEVRDLFKKIDKSLIDVKLVVYKIDYESKDLSSRDTVYTTAICSLYVKVNNKMNVYSIVDAKFTTSIWKGYGHRRYDGKNVFWVNYTLDSLSFEVKPQIYSKKKEVKSVVDNYTNLLLPYYLMQKKPFGKYSSAASAILVTEETYKDIPVYVITIAFKDNDGVSGNIEKHYIRKSNYMPIGYTSFLKWENMEQYRNFKVEYLSVNPDIPLENFKVDKDEAINPVQRYNEFKKKVNIED